MSISSPLQWESANCSVSRALCVQAACCLSRPCGQCPPRVHPCMRPPPAQSYADSRSRISRTVGLRTRASVFPGLSVCYLLLSGCRGAGTLGFLFCFCECSGASPPWGAFLCAGCFPGGLFVLCPSLTPSHPLGFCPDAISLQSPF